MSKNVSIILLTLLIVTSFNSCLDPGAQLEGEHVNFLGTWLEFEYGYYPGGGYIVEPVDPDPAFTMTFSKSLKFSTNIDGLENYKHYRLIDDTANDQLILALFEKNPTSSDLALNKLKHSYNVTLEGDEIKLYYRFCFEGCHIGLRKIRE